MVITVRYSGLLNRKNTEKEWNGGRLERKVVIKLKAATTLSIVQVIEIKPVQRQAQQLKKESRKRKEGKSQG